MTRLQRLRAFASTVALMFFTALSADASTNTSNDEAIWRALQSGGHIVLMRRAQTVPGVGDPPNLNLKDCSTQRNLNDVGRAQSRAWGEAFRTRNIAVGGVFSSVWCRCVDTAKLAFGRVETWPALNSHFDSPASADLQAQQVRGGVGVRMQAGKNLVLVTHQVNVTALSGQTPTMGEAIVLRWDAKTNTMNVIGALKIDAAITAPK
jgi:phosphohistidine phosphatase SixA